MTTREYTCDYIKIPGTKLAMPGAPKSRFDLSMKTTISKGGADEPVQIIACLENSTISPGGLFYTDDYMKGYFQDRVTVTICVDKHPEFRRVSDGPATANGSSSTSSTVSFSLSGGVNAGFFGDTPTGGASANAGMTSSHTFSRNLSDFTVTNKSNITTAIHEYHMNASSGAPYSHPQDLVPDANDGMSFSDHFKGIKLYDPPDLATANLPLLSQITWQANHTRDINETLMMTIQVKQHMSLVSGTNNFFSVDWHTEGSTVTYIHHEPLPLHKLTAMKGTSLSSLGV